MPKMFPTTKQNSKVNQDRPHTRRNKYQNTNSNNMSHTHTHTHTHTQGVYTLLHVDCTGDSIYVTVSVLNKNERAQIKRNRNTT